MQLSLAQTAMLLCQMSKLLFHEGLALNLSIVIGEIRYSAKENHQSFMDFNEGNIHQLRICTPYVSNNPWSKEISFLHQIPFSWLITSLQYGICVVSVNCSLNGFFFTLIQVHFQHTICDKYLNFYPLQERLCLIPEYDGIYDKNVKKTKC